MTAYGIKKGKDPHTGISKFKQSNMSLGEGTPMLLGSEVYFHLLGFKVYSKKRIAEKNTLKLMFP